MSPKGADIEPELFGALAHPLRVRIMQTANEEFSPKQIATAAGESVQLASYHVRILREAGLLELVRTEPRRGAIEHFYRASPDAGKRLAALGETLATVGKALGTSGGSRRRAAKK